jgi:hypothetical protein
MITLNPGWGVQSFTLAAMVALGDLPMIDAAIHADTTHERESTYRFAEKYTPWLEARGVCVVTLSDAEQASTVTTLKTDIPAFTVGQSETGGMLRRQCTGRWKIQPIRRWLQANRSGEPVEQWLGISLDEYQRMKSSDVKYITHRWPLIEKRMTRNDCINWLQRHDLEVPIKSSCVFCPFHNKRAWYEMKTENGADWRKAVEVDEAIRKVRPPFDLFVHSDRIPLIEIRSPQDNGQMELFDQDECSGTCFV